MRTGDDVIKTMIARADVAIMVSEIYHHRLDAISEVLVDIQRILELNHFHSLRSFMQSRSKLDERPSFRMRSEIVDPLTSSSHYRDPTPVAKQLTGDCFVHPSH